MKKLIVITVCLILSFVAFQSQADMYPVTAADKAFFEQIRKAILTEDVKWFSEAIGYPIVLRTSSGEIKLKDKRDFKEHSALVFNARLKSTVRKQSPDSLFKNWQGVMIGNGEIWFSEVGEKTNTGTVWVYRIIGINLPEGQAKKTEEGVETTNSTAGKLKP